MYDVIVIGAGVTGCSIARELMKKKRTVLVIDKASDVCEGTSKANSGIVHAGHDAKPGTLKAKLNVLGSKMMPSLSKELDFEFKQNGSLVLCFDEKSTPTLDRLLMQGKENGVEGLRVLSGDEVRKLEPNVSKDVVAALYAPTGGIVCPFGLTIAMAENASANGADFVFNTEVTNIEKKPDGGFVLTVCDHNSTIKKTDGTLSRAVKYDASGIERKIETKIIINAAGVHADMFHNMISDNKINITARKGEYCLMDKKVSGIVNSTLFQLPTALGKGILVTPTVHGNLLIGPTAVDIDDKNGVNTTADGLDTVLKKGALSVGNLPSKGNTITSFAGLRAHEDNGDFMICELDDAKGFIDVAGIESPGLSSAPAIGQYVANIVDEIDKAEENPDFISNRKGIASISNATIDEKRKLIEADSKYANVICRCEVVTEGEIVDAINRPLGATTLDGVKRRTRAGMGRCQAGFCTPKTVEILARELGCDVSDITKCGGKSTIVTE